MVNGEHPGYELRNGMIYFRCGTVIEYMEWDDLGLIVVHNHGVTRVDRDTLAKLQSITFGSYFTEY